MIDIGQNPVTQTNYTINVSGDFPLYTFELTGGDQSIFFSEAYMAMVAYDICQQDGRLPRLIQNYEKLVNKRLNYYVDFKCENRDPGKWQELISEFCTHYTDEKQITKDPHFVKICSSLEKYGKALTHLPS